MDLIELIRGALHSVLAMGQWDVIAFFGCAAVETCYLPQLVRLYRLKESEEISLVFPALNVLGRLTTVLCLAHLGQNIFAFWIAIGLLLRSSFLGQVIYYRRRRRMLARLQRETVAI
jgi:uncharacterized protein with PQ loop repeat